MTPLTIFGASSVAAWYRADLGVTVSGGTVAAWADQSGNARHFEQATAGNRPAFTESNVAIRGRPSVDFDGVSDYLTHSTAFSLGVSTIICVAKFKRMSTTEIHFGHGIFPSGSTCASEPAVFGNVRYVAKGNGTANYSFHKSIGYSTDWRSYESRRAATHADSAIYTNEVVGTQHAPYVYDLGSSAMSGKIYLGGQSDGGYPSMEDVYELIVLNKLIDANERSAYANYRFGRVGF